MFCGCHRLVSRGRPAGLRGAVPAAAAAAAEQLEQPARRSAGPRPVLAPPLLRLAHALGTHNNGLCAQRRTRTLHVRRTITARKQRRADARRDRITCAVFGVTGGRGWLGSEPRVCSESDEHLVSGERGPLGQCSQKLRHICLHCAARGPPGRLNVGAGWSAAPARRGAPRRRACDSGATMDRRGTLELGHAVTP